MTAERVSVLQLVHGFGLESYGGGAERFAFALSGALDPLRVRVVVCGLWSWGTASEKAHMNALCSRGIHALSLASWEPQHEVANFARAIRALRSYLRHERFDIVHSHSQFGDIAALIQAAVNRELLIVRTPHDGNIVEWRRKPWRRLLLTEGLYPLCYDAEVGVSIGIVRRLDDRRLAHLLGRRAAHIPNAIDLMRFQVKPANIHVKRSQLGLPSDALVIGSVGRFAFEKGFDLLLAATKMVVADLPQTHLVLVGGGELAIDLARLAGDLGLAGHVHFMGPRSDVEEILPCFDLFVSSSRWEGLSTVIMESMAGGVPVIATAVGGAQEIICDSLNGWLVPPEDPRALAEAIVLAVRDRASWKQIAERALQTTQSFSIEIVARQHEELYASLLLKRGHRSVQITLV